MSEPGRTEAIRDALRELIPDLIQDLLGSQAPAGGPEIVPLVPAPPVAAVLRPSTWTGPAVAGEVIGGDGSVRPLESAAPAGAPAQPAGAPEQVEHGPAPTRGSSPMTARADLRDASVETVRIDDDEDLQAFVRSLVTRLESPRDRLAIKAGRLRFRLQGVPGAAGSPAGAPSAGSGQMVRIEKGAVTERHVREAAAHSSRLVLARGAVLTPLARDCARSLGVQVEREGTC